MVSSSIINRKKGKRRLMEENNKTILNTIFGIEELVSSSKKGKNPGKWAETVEDKWKKELNHLWYLIVSFFEQKKEFKQWKKKMSGRKKKNLVHSV